LAGKPLKQTKTLKGKLPFRVFFCGKAEGVFWAIIRLFLFVLVGYSKKDKTPQKRALKGV